MEFTWKVTSSDWKSPACARVRDEAKAKVVVMIGFLFIWWLLIVRFWRGAGWLKVIPRFISRSAFWCRKVPKISWKYSGIVDKKRGAF